MIVYGYIRKSKPKKLTKAAQAEYDEWLKKINSMSGVKKQNKKIFKSNSKMPKLVVPAERSTRHIPSLNSADTGAATKPIDNQKKYTGTKMIGIGTLHKSNAVPIFNSDEAKDIAKMRR